MNQPLAEPLLSAPAAKASEHHRARLLDAMVVALGAKRYPEITIADIVAHARVSKRTFYEHFPGKEECMLALCREVSEHTLALIAQTYHPELDWKTQLLTTMRAYLGHLQSQPVLIRTLFIELLAAGSRGLQVRREIGRRFADFLRLQVELERQKNPKKKSLSPEVAMAVVGGINELVLQAIEEDRSDRLVDLAEPAAEFLHAVLVHLEQQGEREAA